MNYLYDRIELKSNMETPERYKPLCKDRIEIFGRNMIHFYKSFGFLLVIELLMFLRIYTYLAFTCVDCRVAYKDKSTEATMTHENNNYSKTIYSQPQMKKKNPFVIVLKSMTSFF